MRKICTGCSGSGVMRAMENEVCWDCGGKGYEIVDKKMDKQLAINILLSIIDDLEKELPMEDWIKASDIIYSHVVALEM